MAQRRERTFHSTSAKGEVHVIKTSHYADLVAIQAFALKEGIHGWRTLDEGRLAREAEVDRLLGIDHSAPVATHGSVSEFFAAIGYDARAKRKCAANIRALRKATPRTGNAFHWVDDAPYRVELVPQSR